MGSKDSEIVPTKMLKNAASNLLRSVPPQNAFYFYRAMGAPTGAAARNLPDFLGIINTIDITSLQFHLGRGDFENWVKMLGDNTLAKQLAGLKEKQLRGEQLRSELVDAVKARLTTLQKTSP
ncbi:hypothetical protein E6H25_04535 [Candidatus Bathyarchaeota archaeon]|nr:MAG: hypothetical protein E6H25_04535 [Candidatus Bathyarchaeota archaeon]